MSHQDKKASPRILVNQESLRQVVAWLLAPAAFAGMHVRAGSKWQPRLLAAAAIFWAASDHATLTDRFHHARKIIQNIFRRQPAPGNSYRGFMKMLAKWHDELILAVLGELRARMRQELPRQYRVGGFLVFAGDGSRVEAPRTKSNQNAYSANKQRKAKKNEKNKRKRKPKAKKAKTQSDAAIEKKANTTQIWLTLLWHVGTGLPWSWKSGPSGSSERHHLLEMLGQMPKGSLITADAGFVGYDFWAAVLEAEHDFVIRVGANVKLVKHLGFAREYNHTVYLWPDRAAKKRMPPLALRLIVIHDGKSPIYLVTNVMDEHLLSEKQAIEIYRHRWGIELFFRTFKQTFGKHKLRSRAAEQAKLELDWSLVALWSLCLLGQRELANIGQPPRRLSPVGAIKAVQTTMRDYRLPPESASETLWSKLAVALLDDYDRTSCKASRDYPRKKQRERTGAPTVAAATTAQILAARELISTNLEFRSAA